MTHQPTAAVLLIGDELLSGRTRDINLQQVAQFLEPLGIPVCEARTVRDIQDEIVAAVNALRAKYTYVFTTGGIGPTHDDITADAIAAAFGVGISEHPDALRDMAARYAAMNTEFTAPRRRMARVPNGASLVANPVSGAPGFQMENVFTLAGVPQIARAMLEDIGPRLQTGAVVHKVTVRGKGLREGDLAEALGRIAQEAPGVGIGSYPWYGAIDDHGVALVARSVDAAALAAVQARLENLARTLGVEPETLR
ncbi:competence/damage-inducible protein A [Hyphomonas sp.]|uniref:competence/damage-inducible protein A n=1 Tax=Hyphomonas sp. TaxID=87 RepID=UPI00391DA32D